MTYYTSDLLSRNGNTALRHLINNNQKSHQLKRNLTTILAICLKAPDKTKIEEILQYHKSCAAAACLAHL